MAQVVHETKDYLTLLREDETESFDGIFDTRR